jgi:hypothetical protein
MSGVRKKIHGERRINDERAWWLHASKAREAKL